MDTLIAIGHAVFFFWGCILILGGIGFAFGYGFHLAKTLIDSVNCEKCG